MEIKEEIIDNNKNKKEQTIIDENKETNKKEKIDLSVCELIKEEKPKSNIIKEKINIDKIEQKEKIEDIVKKIELIEEEEIKNMKIEPKQEYTILVVHNITPNVTEAHIKEIFSNYGEINNVYIPINEDTSLNKDYAFVEFKKLENAEKAELYMDEGQIDGKVVAVEILAKKNCVKLK